MIETKSSMGFRFFFFFKIIDISTPFSTNFSGILVKYKGGP